MAEEYEDVDALLEAALYNKSTSPTTSSKKPAAADPNKKSTTHRESHRDSAHRPSSSHNRRSHRDRSDRDRSDRDRSPSPPPRRESSSRRHHHRSRSPITRVPRNRSPTPTRLKPRKRSPQRLEIPSASLSPEERDSRTVFCMQLSQRVRARDLEDFFSSVGKVRDVRMITCNKTRRFKGIAYIEFKDIESVALALGLGGQRLLGVPIIVQPSQAEKNRAGQLAKAGQIAAAMATTTPGPMKLYIGSLHFNITEDMLRSIFEPFGRIDEILLMKDHESGRSKGFGFLTFHEGEDAKRAMEQLNGFEIAGRPMKVGYVTEKTDTTAYAQNPTTFLDTDEMDRAGVNLGVTGRLQLMAKLAEGTDLKLPEAATTALNMQTTAAAPAPPISTQCFMLSNMFDPQTSSPLDPSEIHDEVIDACNQHGGAVHIYVDVTSSTGNVYIKCPSISTAIAAVNTLHGRWFGGRVITAAYVPVLNYHSLFPDSIGAVELLRVKE